MQIIITGSLAYDQIMDFPGKFSDHILPEKIHQINLSFLVNKLTKQRGGTAGNIAYNLALLGMKPTILATAGYDFVDYQKELEKVGVKTNLIRIMKAEPTASAYIFTDQSDNQITGFYPGAMGYSSKLSLRSVIKQNSPPPPDGHRGGSDLPSPERRGQGEVIFVVISPNDPLAMMNFVKECIKLDVDYLFDPGMQLPRLSDQDLKLGIEGAKIVIGNDYEMSLINRRLFLSLRGSPDVTSGRRGNLNVDRDQIWITTLGEKGAEISIFSNSTNSTKLFIPPAKPVKVVDPTGAGDAWRAGFLSGYLSGQTLDVCGRMGAVAAVYTVEKYGTQTHKFTRDQFKKRYKENFR